MTATIEVSGLNAGHAGVAVVRDLTFHVNSGEVVALLGANGAGKTTTLWTTSGLLPVLGGEITVLGERVTAKRPYQVARRGLAHVREGRGIFYQLTVSENLALSARSRRAIGPAFDYFPALKPLLKRKAGLLSGGEQQMLALARALLTKPKVLMVDELSLGLAPLIVQEILPLLATIARDRDIGVLLVEQHVQMALAVADRAYVLAHGSLVLSGDAAELLAQPELLHASYLGSATGVQP